MFDHLFESYKKSASPSSNTPCRVLSHWEKYERKSDKKKLAGKRRLPWCLFQPTAKMAILCL